MVAVDDEDGEGDVDVLVLIVDNGIILPGESHGGDVYGVDHTRPVPHAVFAVEVGARQKFARAEAVHVQGILWMESDALEDEGTEESHRIRNMPLTMASREGLLSWKRSPPSRRMSA